MGRAQSAALGAPRGQRAVDIEAAGPTNNEGGDPWP